MNSGGNGTTGGTPFTVDPLGTGVQAYGLGPREESPRIPVPMPYPITPQSPLNPFQLQPPEVATKHDLAMMELRLAAMVRDEIAALGAAMIAKVVVGYHVTVLLNADREDRVWIAKPDSVETSTVKAKAYLFDARTTAQDEANRWHERSKPRVVTITRKARR